jgi:hypothetical protein
MSCTDEVFGKGKAREAAGRGRGMGHVTVTCNACHDQLRQTRFYEPAHDAGRDPVIR